MTGKQIICSPSGGRSVSSKTRPDALLFDMDGVLADVRESYRRCIACTVNWFGGRCNLRSVDAAKREPDSNNDWIVAQRLVRRSSGLDIPLAEITEVFQEAYLGSGTRPGLRHNERLLVAVEILYDWSKRYPLGIVTGRPRAECEWFLDRHGLSACFSKLVCMEDARPKPHPEGILLASENLRGSTTWVFGDSVDDIVSASRANELSPDRDIVALGVLAPGATKEDRIALSGAGAVSVLRSSEKMSSIIP